MAKRKKLSDKQEFFCREYLVDLNGTKAAIRAGYSQNTANEQASQLLAKLNIRTRVEQLKKNVPTNWIFQPKMYLPN